MGVKRFCDVCGKEIGKGTNNRGFMRIEQIFVERDWGLEQVNRSKDWVLAIKLFLLFLYIYK